MRDDGRTTYLSELSAGSRVLAVAADGRIRSVVVTRVKIERRPMLVIRGELNSHPASLMVQDDWHVRVLGPDATVLNVTELTAGSTILALAQSASRHVGYPIEEFCLER